MHADTYKNENSAQGSACKLKFVHGLALAIALASVLNYDPMIKQISYFKSSLLLKIDLQNTQALQLN
jgi:hypothetical protein